jgi:hypothetical protein
MIFKIVSGLVLAALLSVPTSSLLQAETRAQKYRDTHFKPVAPRRVERYRSQSQRKVYRRSDQWSNHRQYPGQINSGHRNFQSHRHPAIDHHIDRLPSQVKTFRQHQHKYYHHKGVFYRPSHNGQYRVVRPPIGARFSHLPAGYFSFNLGRHSYYYLNYGYYLWDRPSRRYVVVEKPYGAEQALVESSHEAIGEVYVYPKQGQTEAQRERDRYECYLWAVEETGFDPGTENYSKRSGLDYRRALTACLEGRGYSVS